MNNELYSVGVDIGGTNTDVGLVAPAGKIVDTFRLSTQAYPDVNPYVSDLCEGIRKMLSDNQITQIAGIGIGAPNAHFPTGSIDNAPNLPWTGKVFLADLLERRSGYKAKLDNDANAAAYGEMIYGGARNMRNFIMMTLGTGVGSGIVVDGKVVYGSTGFAGELGHAILVPGGRPCKCGRQGCLEEYASARGIIKNFWYLAAGKQYQSPLLDMKKEEIGCRLIGKNAEQGDALCRDTIKYTGDLLGIALANAVAFSSPEAIFLMGGPLNLPGLFEEIQASFDRNLLTSYRGTVTLQRSHLPANKVAILGAASLAVVV